MFFTKIYSIANINEELTDSVDELNEYTDQGTVQVS